MEKLTSNKAIVITVVLGLIIVASVALANRNKDTAQNPPTTPESSPSTPQDKMTPKPDVQTTTYSDILPAATGTKVVTLTLEGDQATLTSTFTNGELPIVETGTAKTEGDTVIVTLTKKGEETLAQPQNLTFKMANDELVLENPTESGYGSEGLTLVSAADNPLSGTAWYWSETTMNDGTKYTPQDSTKFRLSFVDAIQMQTTTDCNGGSGGYFVDGTAIAFGPIMSTKMYCEGSLETEYFKGLSEVSSYMIKDNQLVLMYPYDSGSMVFIKASQ